MTPQIDAFLMPSDIDREHERVVIAGMLRSIENISVVVGILDAMDFHWDAHQKIFKAIIAIWEKTKPDAPHLDIGVIHQHLVSEGQLEDVGGNAYLFEVMESDPLGMYCEARAELVKERSVRVALVRSAQAVISEAITRRGPTEELIGTCQREILGLGSTKKASARSLKEIVTGVLNKIDRRIKGEVLDNAVETGFVDLDRITCGLHANELIIMAARPSVGKTALAVNIMVRAAQVQCPCLLISLEQPEEEIGQRILASEGRVWAQNIRQAKLGEQQQRDLSGAAMQVSHLPIWVNDTSGQSVRHIAALARRMKASVGLRLVVIDYLQLIEPEEKKNISREQQVSAMTRALKHLARDLGIPVLCLAQLNRESEHRAEHKPKLSDLRESGSIEQDADVVFLLWRPGSSDNTIEVVVAKQRNGPTGDATLFFDKGFTRFENAAIPT